LISPATASALLGVRLRETVRDVFRREFERRCPPARPRRATETFAPRSSLSISRRAVTMASASVLNVARDFVRSSSALCGTVRRVWVWPSATGAELQTNAAAATRLCCHGFKPDRIHRPPGFGRFIQRVHHARASQLVRHGQIQTGKLHRLGAGNGGAQIVGTDFQTRGNASSGRARRTRRCASRATRNGGWKAIDRAAARGRH